MTPPPILEDGAYSMTSATINTVLQKLVPMIAMRSQYVQEAPIDIFRALGGDTLMTVPQHPMKLKQDCANMAGLTAGMYATPGGIRISSVPVPTSYWPMVCMNGCVYTYERLKDEKAPLMTLRYTEGLPLLLR